MMMVHAFPDAYGVSEVEDAGKTSKLTLSVFGKGRGLKDFNNRVPGEERPSDKELFCYDSSFKKRSKPASHLEALAGVSDEEIKANCPQPLRDLIIRAGEVLHLWASEDTKEG